MDAFNKDALPNGTRLQSGQFIIDRLFSDKGGFSLIYEGRAIRKVEDIFFREKRTNILEEKVIIKELYFKDKAERREGQTALTWRPKSEDDKELIEKFKEKTKSEGEKLANLVHKSPYIITIYAAFEENNTVYLVTKKIENAVDFQTIIKGNEKNEADKEENQNNGTQLSLSQSMRYIRHVCQALQVVHNNNIIHLDVKPSNILRDSLDNAILIDFGISVSLIGGKIKTLLEGAITPHYSPPEQGSKSKKNIGFYSDIYALGATMYFFFTGGNLPPEYADLISSGETFLPPSHYNSEVSDYLDNVVIKCLSTDFKGRYQTMEELIRALDSEQEYNKLVKEAETALQTKEYERGIEAIVATEELIPLTMELHNLKYELQQGRDRALEEAAIKKQLLEAETFIEQAHYPEAIAILQLLPETTEIKNRIVYCEKQIEQKKFDTLFSDALFYEDNGQYDEALATYLQAKKLKQNNKKLNDKIEALTQFIAYTKDKKELKLSIKKYEQKQLDFDILETTVENFLKKHSNDQEIKAVWQNLQVAYRREGEEQENKKLLNQANKAITNKESLLLLEKIPSDSKYYATAQQEVKRINNEEKQYSTYLDYAEKASTFVDTLVYLYKIPSHSKYYPAAQQKVKEINEKERGYSLLLSDAEKAGSLQDSLAFLEKIPSFSKYYVTAQEAKKKIGMEEEQYSTYLTDAKQTKTSVDALVLLDRIPAHSKYYATAQQEVEKIKKDEEKYRDYLADAQKADTFMEALALFEKIPYRSQYYHSAEKAMKKIRTEEELYSTYLSDAQKANTFVEALACLNKIPSHSKNYLTAQEEIRKINTEEEQYSSYLSDAKKADTLATSLIWLDKIPANSQYYATAQQEAVRINKEEEQYNTYLADAEQTHTFEDALACLNKVPSCSKYYLVAQQEIKKINSEEEQYHKYLLKTDSAEALVWLQQIPKKSKYYTKAQKKIRKIVDTADDDNDEVSYTQELEEAKTKIEQKDTESAKTILLKIPKEAKEYKEAKTLLQDMDKTIVVPIPEPEPEREPTPTPTPTPKQKKLKVWRLLLVLLVVAGLAVLLMMPNEAAQYQTAQEKGTIEAYQSFIADFPDGEHIEEAKANLQKLLLAKETEEFNNCFEAGKKQFEEAKQYYEQNKFSEAMELLRQAKNKLNEAITAYDIDDQSVQVKIEEYNNTLEQYIKRINADKQLDALNANLYDKRIATIETLKIK